LNQKKMKKKWPSPKSINWCVFQSFFYQIWLRTEFCKPGST
jgi:hypothetical protein